MIAFNDESLWKKTIAVDTESTYEDNHYYRPVKCMCNIDFDGAGYTYNDEYGPCPFCEHQLVQINGHMDDIPDTGQEKYND